jgi:hypothetical protein
MALTARPLLASALLALLLAAASAADSKSTSPVPSHCLARSVYSLSVQSAAFPQFLFLLLERVPVADRVFGLRI